MHCDCSKSVREATAPLRAEIERLRNADCMCEFVLREAVTPPLIAEIERLKADLAIGLKQNDGLRATIADLRDQLSELEDHNRRLRQCMTAGQMQREREAWPAADSGLDGA